jgi:putative transposase
MARVARVKGNSGIYHIMLRGINKQLILEDTDDNQKFLEVLKECKLLSKYKIYGYCFMGNHIHLLLKVEEEDLEQIFKRIGARYVYYYNWKYKRSGHLFQDRFKSEPIDDDNYLLTVLRYIHNNPVKAGLSEWADKYQWSSYNEYLKSNNLVDVDFVLGMMNRDEFINFHKQQDDENILDIREDRFRMTDTEAKTIIKEVSGAESITDFLRLSVLERSVFIKRLKERGLSIRQISRVTGVSKGIVEKNKKDTNTVRPCEK